jgi:pectate lyase
MKPQNIFFIFLLWHSIMFSQIPVFPEAQGSGCLTPGGREGSLYFVTNLNDSGSGSLREALEAEGPRTVIFRVSGTITVESPLEIYHPFITVAGQTAPGNGIQISGVNIDYSPLNIYTHDVVIRYLHVRTGKGDSYIYGAGDCLSSGEGNEVYNVVIDHCSFSWGNDENVAFWTENATMQDITLQNSIISEALKHDGHSTGLIFGSATVCEEITNIDVHHNLFISNSQRNPLLKGDRQRVINNLIHNYDNFGVQISEGVYVDIIGNVFTEGPDQTNRREIAWRHEPDETSCTLGPNRDPSIYLHDNKGPNNLDGTLDNWSSMMEKCGGGTGWGWYEGVFSLVEEDFRRTSALDNPENSTSILINPSQGLGENLLTHVGASHRLDEMGNWVYSRDEVDERLVEEYNLGEGQIPQDEIDAGGFPVYDETVEPYVDADFDGMSDVWESAFDLDHTTAEDAWQDLDEDGYLNLEEFLNGTNPLVNETLSGAQENLNSTITMYPNPVSNNLRLRGNLKGSIIHIYQIQGLKLKSINSESDNVMLNVSDLASGYYFVRIENTTKTTLLKLKKI